MHPNYQKALNLRLSGRSYGEIAKSLKISKGSLSLWFKSLKLTSDAKKLLEKKMQLARMRGLFKYNHFRTKAIRKENSDVKKIATSKIKHLSKYELLLVGAALYWAEGYNRQDKISSPFISFGNSNPDMIVLFIRFLNEVMKIPNEKIKPTVQIHKNVNQKSAITFWSNIIGIPKDKFHISHQTSRASKSKRPHNSLPYGTLRLNASGRQNFFKIKGWIEGLIK